MELVLTDDQRMIREEALRLLAPGAGVGRTRRVVEAGESFDRDLWARVAGELGWCGMAIPEACGGLGLGAAELVLLMEATGRGLSAIPFWSTAGAAAPLIAAAGVEATNAALLARIAAGASAAVAFGAPGACDPLRRTPIVARETAEGFALDGVVAAVVDLEAAEIVIAPARLGGTLALFALERDAGHAIRPLAPLDASRSIGELTLSDVRVGAGARIDAGGLDRRAATGAIAFAQLCLAAEEIGAARGVMDLTLAYVAGRVQFGRAIASFQAVKHRCARLEVDHAEAMALIAGAAARSGAAPCAMEAAAARALSADLLFRAAQEAIQLHGGVGFTWEYDPHFYLRRAQASGALLGAPSAHLASLAAAMLDDGARP